MPEKNDISFFQKVYQVALLIPYGRVTSYGAIACYIGSPGAARMVGWAVNASHTQIFFIPAHRVVNRTGMLSGKHHFEGINTMQKALEDEGIEVVDNQVIDFKNKFWNPRELDKEIM